MILIANFYTGTVNSDYSEIKICSIEEAQIQILSLRKDKDFESWSLHDKEHKYPKCLLCGQAKHDCL